MTATMARVALFMFLLLGLFLWVGSTITAMTGGDKRPKGGAVEVSPEGGEAIFWGKGRCFPCHSLGGQGSAVRCPNLGQFGDKFALPIGAVLMGIYMIYRIVDDIQIARGKRSGDVPWREQG